MALRVFNGDFTDAVIALTGSCEVDSNGDEPIVDAVDIIDDEADPGSETSCLFLQIVEAQAASRDDNGSIMDIDARRQQLIDLVESFAEVGSDADQHVGFAVRKG